MPRDQSYLVHSGKKEKNLTVNHHKQDGNARIDRTGNNLVRLGPSAVSETSTKIYEHSNHRKIKKPELGVLCTTYRGCATYHRRATGVGWMT